MNYLVMRLTLIKEKNLKIPKARSQFHLTHIYDTWLVAVAFWVYLGLGIVITAIMTIPFLIVLLEKLKK